MNRSYPLVQDALLPYGIPVYQIDQPMMEQAINHGGRILVMATHGPTVENTQSLLREVGAGLKRDVSFTGALVEAAWDHLSNGDIAGHNAVLADAIHERMRTEQIGSVILAQLSMSVFLLSYPNPIAEFGVEVFSSGQSGFEFVRNQLIGKTDSIVSK